jgi:hypothetical protein
MRGQLPYQVVIDGSVRDSDSRYSFAAGGSVLTISTVLPERGLAFELVSTYVGQSGVDTHVTHLALGPVGHLPESWHSVCDGERLSPVEDSRACAYDHAHELVERLTTLGYRASVHLDERTFSALERVD